ncbi:hypothetical protein [Emticicia sp. 17c]|uniref:hypothetical protein n=1 Tax=Emticicia sp. 17c TaxID=3127704 RepID=UPI00301C0964
MVYRALFHVCFVVVVFVLAAIISMAAYTAFMGSLTVAFLWAFGVLEAVHLGLVLRGQFRHKNRALLINNLLFVLLLGVSGYVVYFYANLNSWRDPVENTIVFRTFAYFFDNIFLINLGIFIGNFWFLCRNLLLWSFRAGN